MKNIFIIILALVPDIVLSFNMNTWLDEAGFVEMPIPVGEEWLKANRSDIDFCVIKKDGIVEVKI